MVGSTTTLPLDLTHIARRCNGVYFSPLRFAAVQLAYTNPPCRVLLFHTGRIVGTGVPRLGAVMVPLLYPQASTSVLSLSLSHAQAHTPLHVYSMSLAQVAKELLLPVQRSSLLVAS